MLWVLLFNVITFDGIPLTKINKTHSSGIVSINSPHSYNLQINGVNATTGISGGGSNISCISKHSMGCSLTTDTKSIRT